MSVEINYDTPHMPMSPSAPKRTTCDACRQRKVRCDRTKPECLRCARAGQKCTYPSEHADPARINKVLQELYNRLEHAESRLHGSAGSRPCLESGILAQASENPSDFLNGDLSVPELEAMAVDSGLTTAEGSNFHALDQRIVDDFANAFPSVSTSPGPLFDGFGIGLSSAETVLNTPNPYSHIFMQPGSSVSVGDRSPAHVMPGPGTFQIPPDTCNRLFEAYFNVIQRHLPLINQKDFMSLPNACPRHQVHALRFSICMAGAHVCDDLRYLELHCYITARWHLEQAELEVRGSSVWTLEAAQALVLVARYEINHFLTPKALLTLNRLSSILKVLRYDRIDDTWGRPGAERPRQSPPPPQTEEKRRTYLTSVSLRHRIASMYPPHVAEDEHEARDSSQPQFGDNITQKLASVRQIQIEDLDPFSLFCLSTRVAAETDRHQRLTNAEAEDSAPPSFNFCRTHSRIELEIGALISTLTTSSPAPAISSGLDSDLRVLAILTALGARIQLIKTTILHGRNAKFLEPIFVECHKQNVSTAEDISEVLTQAKVLDTERIRAFREASLYIMPPLALAAESLLFVVRKATPDGEYRTRPRTREIRQSLEVIYKAMEAFKDDTSRYDSCLAEIRAFLEHMQLEMQFRTDFTSFALAGGTTSPQRAQQGAEGPSSFSC